MDKHVDAIEEVVPEIRPGEHLLMGARPLARDCGVGDLPVVILTDASGTVKNVILGYNNDLASDVIQKMALMPTQDVTAPVAPSASDKNNSISDNSIATSMETVHFKEQILLQGKGLSAFHVLHEVWMAYPF